jgi:ATP-dependent RNA helicase DDX56/DBP9
MRVDKCFFAEKGIPLALVGKDILSRARTGSGKTATYAIPILNKILTTPTVCLDNRGFLTCS